jgi:hypothetical protein
MLSIKIASIAIRKKPRDLPVAWIAIRNKGGMTLEAGIFLFY